MTPRSALIVVLLATLPSRTTAQQADVIRGRITTNDGDPIENATVSAASIPNNVNRSARTDKAGRYTLTFANGEGDYWITVAALGFTSRRFELKRIADEEILIADAKLAPSGVVLEAVRVQADRARPGRNDASPDVSGTERSVNNAGVDPSQAGNLAAMAASVPGVQLIPGADGNPDQFSVFGLGGDQNGSTLNGLSFAGSEVPRDAATRSSLGASLWDVSRGGFSGAQFSLRTQSGSNFSARGMSALVNAPPLQWTDRAGRSTGAQYTSASLGAATAGPIALDRVFYSAGYQFDRRASDLLNLSTADALALATAGIARDSLVRLRSILGAAGVPLSVSGLPTNRTNDRGSFLAAIDVSPPAATSGSAFNLTASGSFSRLSAPMAQVTALPTSDVRALNWFGALQGRHTNYFGAGVLTETSLGVTRTRASTEPYLALPSGSVRVASSLDDGTNAVSILSFGGSPVQRQSTTSTGIGGQNQLSWFTADNKHRLKLASELRFERFDQDFSANRLGTFTYNSLADLAAGQPASYMRVLSPRLRAVDQVVGALSLGDSYRPTSDLQVQYGLRLDGNRYLSSPAANPALDQAFGVVNSTLPNKLYLSPRVGFAWTYGTAARLAIANGFTRGPRAVVRGGVGLFQGTPSTQLVAPAMSNTGLPDAVRAVACVGTAVPTPEWSRYITSADAIPTRCADGSANGVFASISQETVLFDRAYNAPRSLRSNLNWSGALLGNRVEATIDGTYSRNLAQPSWVNVNFDATPAFALANEAGRPVFAAPGEIVPGTGAIAADAAHLDAGFGNVIQRRSDMSSVSRQIAVGIRPLSFSTRYSWSLAYVYANTREATRGFSSTSGDPRETAWSRSGFDSRHQILYSLSYNFFDWLPVSLSGWLRSGRPFTPLVASDINGDGFANDRAYVFDPASSSVDPSVATAMRALLASGSAEARACLARELGRIASRNSCEAPWTSSSTLTVGINPVKFRLPQRVNVAFFVNNALGAADLLLHGESNRRGWGQNTLPDPALLFVRGFDAQTRTFRYDVNPRFGATNLSQTISRNPVVVTAQIRLDVGFARERQLLTQSLDRGRGRPGTRANDQDIRSMSGALIPANPMALLLQQADSLQLTRRQADSLATLARAYAIAFDSIWTPVARYLAGLPEEYDRGDAYERYRRARERTVDALMQLAPLVRALLTGEQLRRLPAFTASSLDTRYLASVRSSTAGGASMGILSMLAQMGWTGASVDASSGTPTLMIHR